jgi:lycopene cyclase domain-containing protein
MDPHYTYLLVDLGCIIVPFLFSFHPKLQFYKEWKNFLLPCLLTAAFFIAWDTLYTHLGVWSFNPDYVTGIFLGGIPLEEYLFFICIPFASIFSYHAFTVLFNFSGLDKPVRYIFALIALSMFILGIIHIDKLYTGVTFLLLAACLSLFVYRRLPFLTMFFFCYLFILIPFVISNGILTGSFLNRVIVSYDNNENLGIRILTIPVEDVFYGMLLLILNVYGFERMKKQVPERTTQ